ncbi:GATA zinc finger domain-containing protein 4 isoform X2 [Bombyx mori]
MSSDEQEARRRFSLRTSATFLDGAAKLYKRGIQQLLEDASKLDKEMSCKRRRSGFSTQTVLNNTSTHSSSSVPTPELIMNSRRSQSIDTSPILTIKRNNNNYNKSNDNNSFSFVGPIISPDMSHENTINPEKSSSKNDRSKNQTSKRDQGVQTSSNSHDEGDDITNGFDKNLPFGYILIHDNYNSKIPSRIIFSSLNSEVRRLL